MPEKAKMSFEGVAPVFSVTDVARSRAYYTDHLAFTVEFEWSGDGGTESDYVVLSHGNTALHLAHTTKPSTSIAYFFVNNVEQYHDELQSTDAMITEAIKDFPWEMREFEVKDPDGNKMIFGEHLTRIKDSGES